MSENLLRFKFECLWNFFHPSDDHRLKSHMHKLEKLVQALFVKSTKLYGWKNFHNEKIDLLIFLEHFITHENFFPSFEFKIKSRQYNFLYSFSIMTFKEDFPFSISCAFFLSLYQKRVNSIEIVVFGYFTSMWRSWERKNVCVFLLANRRKDFFFLMVRRNSMTGR